MIRPATSIPQQCGYVRHNKTACEGSVSEGNLDGARTPVVLRISSLRPRLAASRTAPPAPLSASRPVLHFDPREAVRRVRIARAPAKIAAADFGVELHPARIHMRRQRMRPPLLIVACRMRFRSISGRLRRLRPSSSRMSNATYTAFRRCRSVSSNCGRPWASTHTISPSSVQLRPIRARWLAATWQT